MNHKEPVEFVKQAMAKTEFCNLLPEDVRESLDAIYVLPTAERHAQQAQAALQAIQDAGGAVHPDVDEIDIWRAINGAGRSDKAKTVAVAKLLGIPTTMIAEAKKP